MKEPDACRKFYQRSLDDPDAFWAEQAKLVEWHRPFTQVCDFSRPPFARWFADGETNLCHNAVDRHLATRADQPAVFFVSTETGEERTLSFSELHREINAFAAALRSLGLRRGDRVIIYLPMIAEATVAMLACVRLGIIHSAVFAGFAAASLATRIDDARAEVIITADAGMRGGRVVPLKRLVDEAIGLTQTQVKNVVVINRQLDAQAPRTAERDVDYAELIERNRDAEVPCAWLESNEPSYLLYTSGTTARPKGIQRDTGGYAVALAASMRHIYVGQPGETFFSTSDIGWVVGHSYNVYGPLLHGMATVMYEGLPTRPDGAIWWKIAEQTRATIMFTSPTAARVLKKQAAECIHRHDLSRLRYLFLAGEPLDEPTSLWLKESLGHVQIVDNYWQTETGWPLLTLTPGVGPIRIKPGSPGFPSFGYRAVVVDALTGNPVPRGTKGVLAVELPLPPGCMTTVWNNDAVFESHYCGQFSDARLYSTFDYAVQDEDGYFFILGRTDDVINVAGHRLGTREIEEAISSHSVVAEVTAIGVHDEVKGQAIDCFVVLKSSDAFSDDAGRQQICKEIEGTVVEKLGAVARPANIWIVSALPKTRSGKILRRAIRAIAEGASVGDVSTIEDVSMLDAIRAAVSESRPGR